MSLRPGHQLGNFEIGRQLGVGGMGEVYQARDSRLDRDVAIKILAPGVAGDPGLLSRFEREAKLLASMSHSNIAGIHDFNEVDGLHFIVMEKIEGPTLAERLAQGPLALEETLDLFEQIARTLDFAHERGIVHRDLKPANIKITPEGQAVLLDFGLARAFEPPGAPSESEAPTLLPGSRPVEHTQEGVLLGTPAYMSPEQARGVQVDKRTDIWAFGCCLFEALAGQRPFRGDTGSDLLAEILKTEPAWSLLPANTPPSVRRLLSRCLKKDRRERLRDIGDALFEISEARSASPLPESMTPGKIRKTGRIVPWLAAAFCFAGGILMGGFFGPAQLHRRADTGRYPGAGAPSPDKVRRLSLALPWDDYLGDAAFPRLAASPGGSHVAYTTEAGEIFVRSMAEEKWIEMPQAEKASGGSPFFSPTGEWLGYASIGAIGKISLAEKKATNLADPPIPLYGPHWAPDGFVYYPPMPTGGIVRVHEEGGEPESVFDLAEGRDVGYWNPQLLPDGKTLIANAWGYAETGFSHRTVHLDPETATLRTLIPESFQSRFAPTGHIVFVRDGNLMAVRFDPETAETRGAPVTVLEGVETGESGVHGQYSFSGNGQLFYIPANPDVELAWVDWSGNTRKILLPVRSMTSPRISPDGQRLLFRTTDDGEPRVGVYNLEARDLSFLAEDRFGTQAVWSSIGDEIYYDRYVDGQYQVVRVHPDRDRDPSVVYASPDLMTVYSVSPGDDWIAVQQWVPDEARFKIVIAPVRSNGKPHGLSEPEGFSSKPRFSPDGQWVAYTRTESGSGSNVFIEPASGDGSPIRITPESGGNPLWSHDGRTIYFRRGRRVFQIPIDGAAGPEVGEPSLLFEGKFKLGGSMQTHYDIHPEGDRFIMVAPVVSDPLGHRIVVVENWFDELERLVP